MGDPIKYLSYAGLQTYDGLIKGYIGDQIDALDYTIPAGSHTDGKAVVAVSQADGVIAVTEGNVKADYVSYEKVNLAAQGETAVYNTNNTDIQSVITELFAKIATNALAGEVEVYHNSIAAANKVSTISVDGTDYIFAQGGQAIATLNIARDMVISAGSVITAAGTEKAGSGATAASAGLTSGEKYIRLTIANAADTADYIYIPVNSLYKDHTAAANATKIQLAISNSNEISATVVSGSLEWSDLNTAAQNKIDAKKTSITEIASGTGVHITVTKTAGNESNGTGDSYVIAENDIASASDLTAEVTRAQGAETAIDSVVGLTKAANSETRTYTNTGTFIGQAATNTVASDIKALDTQLALYTAITSEEINALFTTSGD